MGAVQAFYASKGIALQPRHYADLLGPLLGVRWPRVPLLVAYTDSLLAVLRAAPAHVIHAEYTDDFTEDAPLCWCQPGQQQDAYNFVLGLRNARSAPECTEVPPRCCCGDRCCV